MKKVGNIFLILLYTIFSLGMVENESCSQLSSSCAFHTKSCNANENPPSFKKENCCDHLAEAFSVNPSQTHVSLKINNFGKAFFANENFFFRRNYSHLQFSKEFVFGKVTGKYLPIFLLFQNFRL